MLILYHREGGWSSSNREKRGDSLEDGANDGNAAHDNKEPEHAQDGLGIDLISFHGRIVSWGERGYKKKQGETCGRKCLLYIDLWASPRPRM